MRTLALLLLTAQACLAQVLPSARVAAVRTISASGIDNALILHYKFTEGAGTSVADTSGNSYTGTLVNGPTWVTGKSGSGFAVQFDNSNDSMNSATVTFGVNVITVCAWIYWDTFNTSSFEIAWELSTDSNALDNAFSLGSKMISANDWNAILQSSTSGNKFRTEAFSWPTGAAWHHYAIVYDNSNTTGDEKVYLDNVLTSTTIRTTDKDQFGNFAADVIYFFSRAGSSGFAGGRLDDFRIYSGELTADEVGLVYNDPQ
jgi:hypothetical protein